MGPFLEMKRYIYQIWKEFVVMHTKNEANFDKNKLKHAYVFHVTQLLLRLKKQDITAYCNLWLRSVIT